MDINFAYDGAQGFAKGNMLYSDIDKFMQEIDFALSLGKYEIFGKVDLFKQNIESLIWGSNVGASEIGIFVENTIRKECYLANKFDFKVSAYMMEGTERDLCIVETEIYNKDRFGKQDNKKYTLLYK